MEHNFNEYDNFAIHIFSYLKKHKNDEKTYNYHLFLAYFQLLFLIWFICSKFTILCNIGKNT